MKSGMIVLVLAALLVAMSVSAGVVMAPNGMDFSVSMAGTKINVQEEVGGAYLYAAENMAALAVDQNAGQAVSTLPMMTDESGVSVQRYVANYSMSDSYNPTPGAGGDGLLARSIQSGSV